MIWRDAACRVSFFICKDFVHVDWTESIVPTPPVNLANIEKATHLIDPVFLHSPQYEDGALNALLAAVSS